VPADEPALELPRLVEPAPEPSAANELLTSDPWS
jgi:hypothetical protein